MKTKKTLEDYRLTWQKEQSPIDGVRRFLGVNYMRVGWIGVVAGENATGWEMAVRWPPGYNPSLPLSFFSARRRLFIIFHFIIVPRICGRKEAIFQDSASWSVFLVVVVVVGYSNREWVDLNKEKKKDCFPFSDPDCEQM